MVLVLLSEIVSCTYVHEIVGYTYEHEVVSYTTYMKAAGVSVVRGDLMVSLYPKNILKSEIYNLRFLLSVCSVE